MRYFLCVVQADGLIIRMCPDRQHCSQLPDVAHHHDSSLLRSGPHWLTDSREMAYYSCLSTRLCENPGSASRNQAEVTHEPRNNKVRALV